MKMQQRGAMMALTMSTVAFATCFASWIMYGVLITFLVDNQQFAFSQTEIGWLLGIPILSGSVMRLPVGILTDKYGGRHVTAAVMLFSAIPLYLVSVADSFTGFFWLGLGFGLCGATFASGVPYLATWFPKKRLGTALGIFGAGNAGATVTFICGPLLLRELTVDGQNLEAWRMLPRIYAGLLVTVATIFWLLARTNKNHHIQQQPLVVRLQPLLQMRVWRFGLYYFLVFGGFVGLSQWLIPYCINVYELSIISAGILASAFSLPAGVVRALGGWMSDRWGARTIMYWILTSILVCCLLLSVPHVRVEAPGQGVTSKQTGVITLLSSEAVMVDEQSYKLAAAPSADEDTATGFEWLFVIKQWHEPVVEIGQEVKRGELLARGITQIYHDANIIVFTILLMTVGIAMGIGSAAVYKHIPVYFPDSVGTTSGVIGVLGGFGGLACPIVFSILLNQTGLWSSCFMFIALVALICLLWMHRVIQRILQQHAPEFAQSIDHKTDGDS